MSSCYALSDTTSGRVQLNARWDSELVETTLLPCAGDTWEFGEGKS